MKLHGFKEFSTPQIYALMVKHKWKVREAAKEIDCHRISLWKELQKRGIKIPGHKKMELSKERLENLVNIHGGDAREVARVMGYHRCTIYLWCDRWGIKRKSLRRGDAHQYKKTHCPRGHEYNQENTYYNPKKQRICRTCVAIKVRERQWKKKGIKYGKPRKYFRHEPSTENLHNLLGSSHDSGTVQV